MGEGKLSPNLLMIYAACDQKYYDQHAKAFIASARLHGMETLIDLIPDGKSKTEYSVARFMRLPELLDQHESILVCDIDSIFNAHIEFDPKYDLGLFFRHWLKEDHLKMLCGVMYFKKTAKPFAEYVKKKILNSDGKWGCDQIALWEAYEDIGSAFHTLHLDHKFMNYDFQSEAPIWTAKGERKVNPAYLARKNGYSHAHH